MTPATGRAECRFRGAGGFGIKAEGLAREMAEGGDEESGEEEDNEAEGDLCGDQSIQGALECGSSPPLGAVTGWMAEERTAGASPKSSVTARVRSEPKARIMTETRTAPP